MYKLPWVNSHQGYTKGVDFAVFVGAETVIMSLILTEESQNQFLAHPWTLRERDMINLHPPKGGRLCCVCGHRNFKMSLILTKESQNQFNMIYNIFDQTNIIIANCEKGTTKSSGIRFRCQTLLDSSRKELEKVRKWAERVGQ